MSDYLTIQVLKTHRPVAIAPRLPSVFEPLPRGNASVPLMPGAEEASPFPGAFAYGPETPAQIAEMPIPDRLSSAAAVRHTSGTAAVKQAAESPDKMPAADLPSLEAAIRHIPGMAAAKQAAGSPDSWMDPATKERRTHAAQLRATDESTLSVRQNSPVSRLAPRPPYPATVLGIEQFADSDAVTLENSPDESRQHATHASPAPSRVINTLTRSNQPEPGRNQILSQVNQEGGPTAVANKKAPDDNLANTLQPHAVQVAANRPGPVVSQPATQAKTGADANPTAVTHEKINQESVTLTMQPPTVKVAATPSSTQSPNQIASQPPARIEADVNPIILNRVELRNDGSTYLVESQTLEAVASAPLPLRDPGQGDDELPFQANPPVVSPPIGADRDRGDRNFPTQLPVIEVAASNVADAPAQLTLAKEATLETDVLVQQKPVVAKIESAVRQKPVVVTTSATAVPHHQITAPDAQKHGWPVLFDQPASAATPPSDPAPTIHVTIGRVEVRAVTSPTTPANRQRPAPTTRSLDDYLRQRREEGS